MFSKLKNIIKEFLGDLPAAQIPSFAAASSYYIFMSITPFLMICVAILQFTPLKQEMIISVIPDYIPAQVTAVLENVVNGIYKGGKTALTISIVLTIWTASSAVKALMVGMDSVYGVRREENFLRFSLRACGYILILVATLLISLFYIVYGEKLLQLFFGLIFEDTALANLLGFLAYMRIPIGIAILVVAFVVFYKWMPASRGRYKHQFAGALFAATAWVVFSALFSAYNSVAWNFGAYGFLGTIIVSMIWINYCMYFLMLGGYINHFIEKRRNLAIQKAEAEKAAEEQSGV